MKNKMNERIDWSQASANNASANQHGYSSVYVNGLEPYQWANGNPSPESLSTCARLVLWLGDDPKTDKPVFGYFDAEEMLRVLQQGDRLFLRGASVDKPLWRVTAKDGFMLQAVTVRARSFTDAAAKVAEGSGAEPLMIERWSEDGMKWEKVWERK